ncbi:MAG: hypothetical protein K2Q34_05975 [Alphaproteobacteria bacterium]|nr:hypothetical protein [Alphaproteobacteria bacterium]
MLAAQAHLKLTVVKMMAVFLKRECAETGDAEQEKLKMIVVSRETAYGIQKVTHQKKVDIAENNNAGTYQTKMTALLM